MSTFGGLLELVFHKMRLCVWEGVRGVLHATCLCVLYDDGSAGLWGLNGCGGKRVPPSIQICIGGTLPAERRETK